MVKKAGDGEILRCSFCNKDQNDVRKLIAGPTVFICDECVEVCNDIIADDNRFENRGVRSALPSPPEIKKFLAENADKLDELNEGDLPPRFQNVREVIQEIEEMAEEDHPTTRGES